MLLVPENGKAGGFYGVVREHIIYSHPALVDCLMLLFNIMCIVYTVLYLMIMVLVLLLR